MRRVGYLDLRDKESVKIRLIGMKDRATANPHIYMRLYYKDTSRKGPSNCLKTELENYSRFGKDDFVLYFINSQTLNPGHFEQVSRITISTDKQCKNESNDIYIQSVEPKEYQYNFGMCLHKSVEGKFKPKVLLDWVKLNIALGAEFMTLYLQAGAEGVYDILLPYINRGIVEVLDWKLEPGITDRPSYHFGQTGVIVECLWRNIYRTRYLGLNDVDEFLVPQKHKTLPEMILHVETLHKSKKPVASFVLTNTLMKDNGSLLPVVEKALQSDSCSELDRDTLSVYFKRTKSCLCFGANTKKMILKPDAVYIPWVHFLYTYRSKHYTKQYSVPDDVGLSYHYRPGWKKYSGCSTPVIENRSIEKYFKNITNC